MEAKRFYDEKESTKRTLHEGSTVRNTHNFIKAVLIKRFVSPKKRILDLGCGQGGDLIKLKYSSPSLYVGIDISHKAIVAAQDRASKIKLKCRQHFLCTDFTKHDWEGYPPYDVINCQFAIQFAFQTMDQARFTFEKVSRFLVEDGFFIGSIPQYENTKTLDEITVNLPDDERDCKEYAVQIEELCELCEEFNLCVVLVEKFQTFYKHAIVVEETLAQKMNAFTDPDPNNMVFAFQKRILKKN